MLAYQDYVKIYCSVHLLSTLCSDSRGGGGGDFLAGFLLGGAVFGTLAYIFAPQVISSYFSLNSLCLASLSENNVWRMSLIIPFTIQKEKERKTDLQHGRWLLLKIFIMRRCSNDRTDLTTDSSLLNKSLLFHCLVEHLYYSLGAEFAFLRRGKESMNFFLFFYLQYC